MSKIAIYPGTFDPIHNGHLEIVRRGLKTFDKIIIAIGVNPGKDHFFALSERVEMIQKSICDEPRLSCESFSGLLMKYAKKKKAVAILRGLRAVSDFEFEFQLALMNRKLNRDIETFFLMTAHRYLYVSSTIIKATFAAGGRPKGLMPDHVFKALQEFWDEVGPAKR
jgi:pantetheine-phosphate adenylyltransferase